MKSLKCPNCGSAVTDELPGGLCPACLINVARRSGEAPGETAPMSEKSPAPSLAEMRRLFPELDIMELVGHGGMGAVYRVVQKNLDRVVALKVFLYRPDDPEFAARFQREARALARLNHPNIVTVHDFGSRENVHYLLMEFVDGLNLRQLTREERLSPEMALQMVPQLCDALQYAHDQGVIHRDIKPENLLLHTDGRIKIADFGLAKMTGNGSLGTLTHTRQVMGTLNYMAPEQRERPMEVDHRADIYSLGVVIYEMLTGELPIGRFQPPSNKSELDARLDEVVMRALEKEPDLRYQQASEFKTGFETAGNVAAGFTAAGFTAAQPPVKPTKGYSGHASGERRSRVMISMMAGQEKKGKWRPGNPQIVLTCMGGSMLDLTEVDAAEVDLTLFTLMGGAEVIVPHGAEVDLDGFILMGATTDNVKPSNAQSSMRVRIRSWGAMGGCDIRTPKPGEDGKADLAATSIRDHRLPAENEFTIRGGLVFLYKCFAMLVGFAAVAMFLLSAVDVVDDNTGKMLGILMAIACGMFWAGLDYFRRIIGAGPENRDGDSVRQYFMSTLPGTLIRCVALLFGFACPALFVVASFENGSDGIIRLGAIFSAITCGALYLVAGFVEDHFYGKPE